MYNFLLHYRARTEISHVRQLRARYVMLFYCSSQSIRRVRRYARSIGKVHSCKAPPETSGLVRCNFLQSSSRDSSSFFVLGDLVSSLLSSACIFSLLRLVFFVSCRLFQHVKFDILVTTVLLSVRDVRFDEFYFFHELLAETGIPVFRRFVLATFGVSFDLKPHL